ncbi:DedA family protein [Micromonospora sp. NPDC004704]
MEIISAFVDWLAGLSTGWLYLTAAVVLAAEVAVLPGMVLPAATTMLTVGFLARAGDLDPATALVVTSLAAMLGDHLGFLEGRLVGPRLRRGRFGRRIDAGRWERAERLLTAGGGPAIVLGRWTPYVRTLVPRMAAVAGLPYRRFAVYDAAAVLVWVPGIFLIGYLAGASYLRMGGLIGTVVVIVVAVAGLVTAGVWAHRRRGRGRARRDRESATGCRGRVRHARSPLRRRGPDQGRRTRPDTRTARSERDPSRW